MGGRSILGALIVIIWSGGLASAQQEIRIGILAPGPAYGPRGAEIRASVESMKGDIGAKQPVQFYFREYHKPDEARVGLERLTAEDKVDIIIGPADRLSVAAVRDLIGSQKILIPIGTSYDLGSNAPAGIVQFGAPIAADATYSPALMTKSALEMIGQARSKAGTAKPVDILASIKNDRNTFDTALGKLSFKGGALSCDKCAIICTPPKVVCNDKCCDK